MRASLAVWFAAFALATRLLVPFGFMPASGQPFAIVHCAGASVVAQPADSGHAAHGTEHGAHHGAHSQGGGNSSEEPKAPQAQHDGPCAFAGVGNAVEMAGISDVAPIAPIAPEQQWPDAKNVGIGHGLAAPPPPSTGPPALT